MLFCQFWHKKEELCNTKCNTNLIQYVKKQPQGVTSKGLKFYAF
nr:MAG TPA: hypothetical protein [Caudoviricetes sp.]